MLLFYLFVVSILVVLDGWVKDVPPIGAVGESDVSILVVLDGWVKACWVGLSRMARPWFQSLLCWMGG